MATELTPEEKALHDKHSKSFWFFKNIIDAVRGHMTKHRIMWWIITILFVLFAFANRHLAQPLALGIRAHFLGVLIVIGLLWAVYAVRKRFSRIGSIIQATVVIGIAWFSIVFDIKPHRYVARWYHYTNNVKWEEVKDLPLTDYERIQPLHSIRTMADESMSDTQEPTEPDFVRGKGGYKFTFGIEPAYTIPRLFRGIEQVVVLDGTSPSPSFSNESRKPARFDVGEDLLMARNTRTAVTKTFGLFDFWSYKAEDVKFIEDDKGELVQVVTLSRTVGTIFPRQEFGGVQVIRQHDGGFWRTLRRIFFGVGEWVAPEDVHKHAYLKGQNIVPYQVSRFTADTFRFQAGFIAPLPGNHRGDMRIPDIPGDYNDMPYTIFARFGGENDRLYHYFGMEPYDQNKQGLNTSLFIPADGIGPIKVYHHSRRNDGLIGVSAVPLRVIESRKQYDWSKNKPAEQRPYIKNVDGVIRFFWLTTVVTMKEGAGHEYIAGGTPEVVITDAAYRETVWVTPATPGTWVKEVSSKMSEIWQTTKPDAPVADSK